MITVRKSNDRGHANYGWLNTRYTFSFADYHDPNHMGFRHLRVINDDWIQPGGGFDTHPHRDMEIITYILAGELEHRDSMGSGAVIRRGDIQMMSAGTGITHSERNPSPTETTHLLQIWIFPERKGVTPRYADKHFGDDAKRGRLCFIASREGRDGSFAINQDADVYASILAPNASMTHQFNGERHAWLHLVQGAVTLNGVPLSPGDGAAISGEKSLIIESAAESEFLLFDMG